MVLSAACFAAAHSAIRKVSADIHPFEIALIRNLFGLMLLAPWLAKDRFRSLRTTKLNLHFLRAILNAGFMLGFFYGLSLIPVADATALNFSAPLFGSLLAVIILKEKVGWRRWGALIIGFASTLVILRPGLEGISLGAVLVLLASLSWGGVMICVKKLGVTESSLTTTTYLALFLTPITLVVALPFWVWPDGGQIAWLIAIAAFSTIAQLGLAESMKWADASMVLPFDFSRLIFAAIFGFLLFTEIPDFWTIFGGLLIFGSAIFITVREAQLRSSRN